MEKNNTNGDAKDPGSENHDDDDDSNGGDEDEAHDAFGSGRKKLPHSSSSHDVTATLGLIKEFWTLLGWSASPAARPHLATLIEVR